MPPRRSAVVLGVVLLVAWALYGGHAAQFFCGDSIYWFSRVVADGADLAARLRRTDDLGQYRPLTFVFFSYVVYPIAGLDPLRNHVFPFLFHGLNTLLVYGLSRRILGERESLTAAFVFGVSPVAAYVTYDNTFLPDYLYVFFYLASLCALPLEAARRSKGRLLAAFALFVLALLTKEAAASYPAAAAAYLALAAAARAQRRPWKHAAIVVAPFAAAVAAYVLWHLAMKGGSLYPTDPSQPHHLELGWANLRAKLGMIAQAAWLPVHLPVEPRIRAALLGAVAPLVAWIAFALGRGVVRRTAPYLGALVWSVATVAPALLVAAPTWEHNLYLPLAGLAWIAAAALEEVTALPRRAVIVYAAAAIVASTAVAASAVRRSSWMALGSKVTGDCLADLRRMFPRIEPNTLIYLEPTREHNVAWHFDSGRMPASFYRDPSIRMRFAGDGRPAPSERMLRTGKVIVLGFLDGRLYDATPPVARRETPPQPSGIRITPSPMRRGEVATIEVFGGEEMEVDCRYTLSTEGGRERTLVSWLTTDVAGRQQLAVDRPGRYRITAIRNGLRSDWVTIDYEWVCLP